MITTTNETLTLQHVIDKISTALCLADGDTIANIYNDLHQDKVMYVGDSMFESRDACLTCGDVLDANPIDGQCSACA
jgi:hypothetical protein